jgi:hypothetical protein
MLCVTSSNSAAQTNPPMTAEDSAVYFKMVKLFPPADSLIEGRGVSFYLSRNDVPESAKRFYHLNFIPYADMYNRNVDTASELGDSLLTKNDTTRPFYYFLFLRLHQTVDTSFRLLSNMRGVGNDYSMTFVDEFYEKLRMPQYKKFYTFWVEDVANDVPNVSSKEYRQMIIKEQLKHAKKVTSALRKEIKLFADSVAKRIKY